MADVCACCGKIINGYFRVEIDGQIYKLCEICNRKIKKGEISVDDWSSSIAESIEESIKREEERGERKLDAQKENPLYDDIHQIAGDLRFLKNLVIIGLVISVISGILSILIYGII